MKPRLLVTTAQADEDARQIDEWWLANHGASNLKEATCLRRRKVQSSVPRCKR